MTTTAYDTNFIASDIAFTDTQGNVHLNIPFRKVKRIEGIVLGMAGCLDCMKDYTQMIIDYVTKKSDYFDMPSSITNRQDRDFLVMIYLNGTCLQISKPKQSDVGISIITQIPTVIGSGSSYVQNVLDDCKNAVVAVLEAIKHDKYTDGDVKYCSIKRRDVHNLEDHPMSAQLKIQLTGIQQELDAANEFLVHPSNAGKAFHASTETFHAGEPSTISLEAGMLFLKQGFSEVRDSFGD